MLRPEEMTVAELESELTWLESYQRGLEVDDPDREWDQVTRDIDRIRKLLRMRRVL